MQCKLTGLGLSLTQQTIIFSPVEIIRCRDYTTIHTPPGWLDKERSDRIKQGVEAEHSSKPGESETVMNDVRLSSWYPMVKFSSE